MPIDIIGDVHGQFDKLVGLLSYMGYRETAGTWRHPSRSAVFVGDIIDRGPKQLATIDLVRGMVEAGSAQCVLGNHEFNAERGSSICAIKGRSLDCLPVNA